MKKFCTMLLACTTAVILNAARPGEVPGTPPHQLNWVDCSPMPMGRLDPEIHKDIPELRAIVFLLTRAKNTPNTIAMLEELRRQHRNKLLISVITPDNVSDAENLRKNFPDMRLRLAVDTTRKLTPEYMSDTIMLFPMAFLMDKNGMIRWRGEAVDLPEALDKLLQDKLPLDVQKKVTPMIYAMHQQLKDGNIAKALTHAEKILAADPGNPAALRLAVFAGEHQNTPGKSWQFVAKELKKAPDTPRIYFMALDLVMRHPECRKFLGDLIDGFAGKPFPAAIRCAFADTLLNSFPFEIEAVFGAEKILAGTPMPINALPGQMAHLLAVRARLHYAMGNLKAAERDLAEAVQFLKAAGSAPQQTPIQKQLDFIRALLKHTEQKKQ